MDWNITSKTGLPEEDVNVLVTYEYDYKKEKLRDATFAYFYKEKPDVGSIRYYWKGPGFYQYLDSYEPEWAYICAADKVIAWTYIRPYTGER